MFMQTKNKLMSGASPLAYDTAAERKSKLPVSAKDIASIYTAIKALHQSFQKLLLTFPTGTYNNPVGAGQHMLDSSIRRSADKEFILRKVKMSTIGSTVKYGGSDWEDRKSDIEAKLTKLMGKKVALSDKYHRDENGSYRTGLDVSTKLTYPDMVRTLKILGVDIEVPKIMQSWGKLVDIGVRLYGTMAYARDSEGTIDTSPNASFSRVDHILEFDIVIRYPMEDALYMCMCEDNADNFSMHDFITHLRVIEYHGMGEKHFHGNKIPSTLSPKKFDRSMAVRQTMSILDRLQKDVGSVPPRANEDGFTVLLDGSVCYTNLAPQLDEYLAASRAMYNSEEGRFEDDDPDKAAALVNRVLSVDWQGNTIVYTNTNGNYSFIDLKGSQALTDVTIGAIFRKLNVSHDTVRSINALAQRLGLRNIDIGLIHSVDPEFLMAEDGYTRAVEFYTEKRQRIYYSELDFASFRQTMDTLFERFDSMEMSLAWRMRLRFWVYLFGKYAKPANYPKFTAAAEAERQHYQNNVEANKGPLQVTGLPGLTHTLPHQHRILSDMQVRVPRNAMLSVNAGGGKTATYTSEISDLLSRGVIKRAAIVLPKGLRPQVYREQMRFSDNGLRTFVLDASHWDRFAGKDGPFSDDPYRAYEALIDIQPKNTIFLVDFGMLKLRSRAVRIGTKQINTYPFSVWLSKIFDYVIADESHKIKNIESQTSEAFKTFTPYAKYRRIASGTIVHNTPSDLYGQVNVFGPDILAPVSHILENKSLSPDEIKTVLDAMKDRVKQYTAETYEWSFLLPKINERIHTVGMTDKQRAFYEKAFQDMIVELENDAKFSKMMDSGDPSMEEKIVAHLRAKVTPLEIFINAPGGNSVHAKAFRQKTIGLSDDDLVSPKSKYIDGLLDKRLASDSGKVLIVSYNKEISKHLFEHSKHRKVAMHYTSAGQKEGDLIKVFQDNPAYRVMFADETTLKEGHNLQICSAIYRVQTVWTPGDYLQALARVIRPEVPDANGKLKYDRKSIDFEWIIFEPSLEVTKTARLYSKIIKKALIDRVETNSRFKDWTNGKLVAGHTDLVTGSPANYSRVPELLNNIGQLTMNLTTLRVFQTSDSLKSYVDAYSSFMQWTDNEFDLYKEHLRKLVAKEKGVDPSSISDTQLRLMALRKNTHVPFEGAGAPAVFGEGYIPFLENAAPNDRYNLGLVPLTSVAEKSVDEEVDGDDEDSEEDEIDTNDLINVEIGDLVVTEYGFAHITRVNRKTVRVEIKGLGIITIPRAEVLVPEAEADKHRMKRIYRALVKRGIPTSTISVGSNSLPQVHTLSLSEEELMSGTGSVPPTQKVKDDFKATTDRIKTTAQSTAQKPVGAPNYRRPTPIVPTPVPKATIRPPVPSTKPAAVSAPAAPIKPKAPAVKPVAVKPAAPVKPVATSKKKLYADFMAAWINGQPCVVSFAEDKKGNVSDETKQRLTDLDFIRVPTCLSAQIKTWQGLANLLQFFDKQGYHIPDEHRDNLETTLKAFKAKGASMDKLIPNVQASKLFVLDNRKKVEDQDTEIHPYLVMIGDELHIMINAAITRAARPLVGKMPVAGITRFEKENPYYVKFYRSKKALMNDMISIEEDHALHASNEKQFVQTFHDLG